MKKYFLVIIAISLIATKALCQSFEPYISIGYGEYKMDNLKAHQAKMYIPYDLPMTVSSSFPGYINYEGGINYSIKEGRFKFGLLTGYQSTSGRLSVKDYSGAVAFDQLLTAFNYSALGSVRFMQFEGFNFNLILKPGIIFTKYEEKRQYPEYSSYLSDSRKYDGSAFILECNLHIIKTLKHFDVFAQFGYAYDTSASLTTDDEFWSAFESELSADWSGLRIKAGVSFNLQKQKQ